MDFLEGFLLGPLWSDTEFETRKHRGFYWSFGLAFSLLLLYLVLFPEKSPLLLGFSLTSLVVLFIILALISPFISHLYYRMLLPVKLGILLLQALKYAAGMLYLLRQVMTRIHFDSSSVGQDSLDLINKIIGATTDYFTEMAQGTGMIVGIVVGGLGVVLGIIVIVLLALVIPIIWLFLLRLIQSAIDQLAVHTVIKDLN
ncbi:MAG: hypothetical protein ACOX1T_00615 [Saccharofermentanales bacterium]|jgi:hypothetical protein